MPVISSILLTKAGPIAPTVVVPGVGGESGRERESEGARERAREGEREGARGRALER